MTYTIDNVFNNRVFDIVRNFTIAHRHGEEFKFKVKHDPADMIFIVRGDKLHATIDTAKKRNAYEIASIKHLETLLYLPDEDITEDKRHERFAESLFENDYLIFSLSEYITTNNRSIFDVVAGGQEIADYDNSKADLAGEVAQLHLQLIGIKEPPQQFIDGLKMVVELINDEQATADDIKILEAKLNALHTEYKGL